MRLRAALRLAAVGATLLGGTLAAPPLARGGPPEPCPRSIAGLDLERQEVDDTDLPGSRGLACFYEEFASVSVLYFVTDEGTTGSCTDDARDRLGPDFTLYDPNRERRVVVSGDVPRGEPRPFIDAGYALLDAYAPLAAPCVTDVTTTEAPTVPSTADVAPNSGATPVSDLAADGDGDDSLFEGALFLAVGIIMFALGIFFESFARQWIRFWRYATGQPSDGYYRSRFPDREWERDD